MRRPRARAEAIKKFAEDTWAQMCSYSEFDVLTDAALSSSTARDRLLFIQVAMGAAIETFDVDVSADPVDLTDAIGDQDGD